MRYLVTGGAGFIGSHLAGRLLRRGDDVVVLDDLSTGSLANLGGMLADPRFRFRRGSVTDRRLVAGLVGTVEAVFHLAAAVGVRLVMQRPDAVMRDNIVGARAVLDAAARHGRPTLIASSSEVYGNSEAAGLSETDVPSGFPSTARWAYARSKLAAESDALARHRVSGLPVVVARLFNTVGPRQTGRYGMVVPRLLGQALAGQDLTVYGDGRQSRCFCDVDDTVEALVGLLDEPRAAGQVWNVGSTHEISVRRLAEAIVCHPSSRSRVRLVPYEQVYGSGFEDVRRRVPDTRRIQRLLGWQPRRELDATLARMVAWMSPAPDRPASAAARSR